MLYMLCGIVRGMPSFSPKPMLVSFCPHAVPSMACPAHVGSDPKEPG